MECNFENCPNFERYGKQIAELKAENERLKKENEILLCQLVINDGEDVTVQISESQFDKYNKYKQTLQDIKETADQSNIDCIYRISVIRKILTKAESEEE